MILNSSRAALFHVASNTFLSRPTTDLYFANAMGYLIRGIVAKGPIQPIGINSFRVGDIAILLRQDTAATMHELLSRRWRKLVYVVDDDIEAGLHDLNLSKAYRNRLEKQYYRCFRPMLHAADQIITGSRLLAEKLAKHAETHAINPYWRYETTSIPSRAGDLVPRPFRIAYLGAMSHAADIRLVLPAIEKVLSRYPEVEFTTFVDTPQLRRMSKRYRVVLRPMRTWHHYRRWVGAERFHLALYPVLDTPFNQARSVNKLIEHTIIGAVGIYSKSWAQAAHIEHGKNGFLAGSESNDWADAIEDVVSNPKQLESVFHGASCLSDRLNDERVQGDFWRCLLAL